MTTRYYKVTNRQAIEAWTQYLADKKAILESARPLADRFNGEILTASDVTETRFRGLQLKSEPANPDLWTKPNRQARNAQQPRKTVPAALKGELKELTQEWESLYPTTTSASKVEMYDALGINWGALLFTGGFSLFEYDGALWLGVGLTVETDGVKEITGTEFEDARRSFENEQKAA